MENKNLSLNEFVSRLGSSAPTPGGGGAAALTAAQGAALGEMVCRLTVGKKAYAQFEDDIKSALSAFSGAKEMFLDMIDKDEQSFLPLSEAYKIPKDDPTRDEIMERALYTAANAPLEVMALCGEIIERFESIEKKCSRLVKSDVAVGVNHMACAMMCACTNVYINTRLMKNREKADEMNDKAEKLMEKYLPAADDVFSNVIGDIS